jgi:hypothetical protein
MKRLLQASELLLQHGVLLGQLSVRRLEGGIGGALILGLAQLLSQTRRGGKRVLVLALERLQNK